MLVLSPSFGGASSEELCLASRVGMAAYALYKPRGVLSAASPPSSPPSPRRTLSDLIESAGLAPLSSHVGRLDAESSGLLLVAADSLLLRGLLGSPSLPSSLSLAPVPKVYSLLIGGNHPPESERIQSLRQPLLHQRGGKARHSLFSESPSFIGPYPLKPGQAPPNSLSIPT